MRLFRPVRPSRPIYTLLFSLKYFHAVDIQRIYGRLCPADRADGLLPKLQKLPPVPRADRPRLSLSPLRGTPPYWHYFYLRRYISPLSLHSCSFLPREDSRPPQKIASLLSRMQEHAHMILQRWSIYYMTNVLLFVFIFILLFAGNSAFVEPNILNVHYIKLLGSTLSDIARYQRNRYQLPTPASSMYLSHLLFLVFLYIYFLFLFFVVFYFKKKSI